MDRTHIQTLMHHKDKRRISAWLKDLREKHFIEWIYDRDSFVEKTKPAVYYLGLNGIRYLKTVGAYPVAELRKRYKESSRQQSFITRCMLITECCVTLESSRAGTTQYSYVTEADYVKPDNIYNFLSELRPHLCYEKKEGKRVTNYLLEVFDMTTPHYMIKKRLKEYVDYLDSSDWEDATGDKWPPIVLIACPSTAVLTFVKRRVRKQLEDANSSERVHVRFATTDKIRANGVNGMIWEEA